MCDGTETVVLHVDCLRLIVRPPSLRNL